MPRIQKLNSWIVFGSEIPISDQNIDDPCDNPRGGAIGFSILTLFYLNLNMYYTQYKYRQIFISISKLMLINKQIFTK